MRAFSRGGAILLGTLVALVLVSGCDAIVGVKDLLPGSDGGRADVTVAADSGSDVVMGADATVDPSPGDSKTGDMDGLANDSGQMLPDVLAESGFEAGSRDSGNLDTSTEMASDSSVDTGAGDSSDAGSGDSGNVDSSDSMSGDSGDTGAADSPDDALKLNGITAVSAGGNDSCALTTGGDVLCWGDNSYGELGSTSPAQSLVPVAVSGLPSGVAAVSAGSEHTCALTAAGGVVCWGDNTFGELGNNSTCASVPCSVTPVPVSGLSSGVAAIAAAGYRHTCALTTTGGVQCWGDNEYGQLGNNSTTPQSVVPVAVSGLSSGVAAIAAGGYHTCALTTAGGVQCWGYNYFGELGNNSTTGPQTCAGSPCSLTPVAVSGLSSGVTAITAGGGGDHTCALTTSGGVQCWGDNTFGQLGNNSTTQSNVPVAVSGLLSGVIVIAAGGNQTCATTAGSVQCWGLNDYGQLGDNSMTGPQTCAGFPCSMTPVAVSGLSSGIAAVVAGTDHTCAFTTAGGIQCWGWNKYGQIGNNSTTNSLVPASVAE